MRLRASLAARFIPAGAGNTVKGLYSISVDAVYPRWRGEHGTLAVAGYAVLGLSPLARGTL